MIARKNPPSFILVDKATGEVVYTKRATGVGSEAISKCVERGHALARRTGRTYFVYLDIMGARVGMKLSVPMAYALGITEEISPSGSVRPNPRGPVRRNVYTFNNPPSGPADQNAARELELYIENDADLYRQQYIPIVKNLMLKRQKGTYNRELAVKLFMYLMDAGAKKYIREFGTGGNIDTMFNRNTRLIAARSFRDSFEGEAGYGNWDHLLVRPTTRGLGATIARKGASTEFEMDMGMFEKGYRYKLIPKSKAFDPLYAKSVYDVPKVMREYPHETFTTVDLSPPRSAHENPRGRVRKNIYTFNNPKKYSKYGQRSQMERAASLVGLYVTTWAPGDGMTRYRFHRKPADYHDGSGIYTANGRGEAMKFIQSYGIGRSRMNPLSRSEVARAVHVGRRYIDLSRRSKKHGNTHAASEALGTAVGMGTAIGLFGVKGTKQAGHKLIHRAADVELGLMPNPCKNNACSNPRHKHVRKNPLLQTVLLANPGSVKTFTEMQDVGKAKYVVNYHDGVKVHRDGSPFFDIAIFRNRAKKDQFVRKLESLGFTRGSFRNPPISAQWDRLTGRQRLQILGFVGFEDTASRYVRLPWNLLSSMVKQALEQYWLDSTSTRGTTRRRMATVGANPLTRKESGQILARAKRDLELASSFRGGHTRSARSGMAQARGSVVRQYGPTAAIKPANKIMSRAAATAGTAMSNPGTLRLPRPGTRMTVSSALELARRIGDRGLIEQCQKALKLQKAANKDAKCVIWKTFAMGSKDKIDSVVALTHYGDSPETMYKPPKGSKKGNHMYRHTWGEKGGKKSVPLLASADGKMLLMPLEGRKVAGDWLRH